MVLTPNSPRVQPCAKDRAAVVTTAILQIVKMSMRALLHGDAGALRDEIEATLRNEFADIARTTLNEIRE
jgi:hypothetical protein